MTIRRCVGATCAVLLASACSSVPSARNMQVTDYLAPSTHEGSVGLQVDGGWELTGQITNPEFAKAVESSLVASKVFTRLVQLQDAVYRLDVVVDDLRQPPGGFNMTTEMTVLWSLSRVDTQETVWQALVASRHTADVGEAFAGAVRLRKATEGAARDNIRQALELLANADLRPPEAPGSPETRDAAAASLEGGSSSTSRDAAEAPP
jgi:hypothetical protein